MDMFRELSIEFKGIKGAIKDYTSEPCITNYLDELEKSILLKNRDEIVFLLDKIIIWFAENQSNIESNQFVMNGEKYKDYQEILISFFDKFKAIDNTLNFEDRGQFEMKKIFISHSSKDKDICDAFVDVLEQLGVHETDILYTSSDRHGVPGDEDIFEYLKKHITERINVFYMLSDNYYKSAYCLNEMGASWIVQNEYSIFILPNLNCGIQGVIDSKKKGYNLASSIELIGLKEKITKMYNTSISEKKWEDVKSKFLTVVLR
ncbi:MAG: toll/interleukin-1 receptor domain-containing protein [Desulfosporosinus sp.]|nr:toll/interleukin-1 receptor domain-containing protein [Desulfosporosinus sp.]